MKIAMIYKTLAENAEEKKQIRMGKALSGVTGHDTHVFALSHEIYQRGNLLCFVCDFSQAIMNYFVIHAFICHHPPNEL